MEESLVSFGPKVVPAPREEPRADWFCEADIVCDEKTVLLGDMRGYLGDNKMICITENAELPPYILVDSPQWW